MGKGANEETEGNADDTNLKSIEDEMAEFDDLDGSEVSFDDETESEEESNDEANEDDEGGEASEEEEKEESDTDEEEEEDLSGDTEEGEEEEDEAGDETADDEDEVDERDEIIETLRNSLSDKAATKPAVKTETKTETETEETADETAAEQTVKDFVYATEENFDDILRNPESFNKALNAGIKEALEQANTINQQNAVQAVSLNLSSMVSTQIKEQRVLDESVKGFYDANPLLTDFRNLVGNNINEIISSEPDLSLTDVMDKAAERVYKQLHLSKDVVDEVKKGEKAKKTNKAKNTGLRKSGNKGSGKRGRNLKGVSKTALQNEMDELI